MDARGELLARFEEDPYTVIQEQTDADVRTISWYLWRSAALQRYPDLVELLGSRADVTLDPEVRQGRKTLMTSLDNVVTLLTHWDGTEVYPRLVRHLTDRHLVSFEPQQSQQPTQPTQLPAQDPLGTQEQRETAFKDQLFWRKILSSDTSSSDKWDSPEKATQVVELFLNLDQPVPCSEEVERALLSVLLESTPATRRTHTATMGIPFACRLRRELEALRSRPYSLGPLLHTMQSVDRGTVEDSVLSTLDLSEEQETISRLVFDLLDREGDPDSHLLTNLRDKRNAPLRLLLNQTLERNLVREDGTLASRFLTDLWLDRVAGKLLEPTPLQVWPDLEANHRPLYLPADCALSVRQCLQLSLRNLLIELPTPPTTLHQTLVSTHQFLTEAEFLEWRQSEATLVSKLFLDLATLSMTGQPSVQQQGVQPVPSLEATNERPTSPLISRPTTPRNRSLKKLEDMTRQDSRPSSPTQQPSRPSSPNQPSRPSSPTQQSSRPGSPILRPSNPSRPPSPNILSPNTSRPGSPVRVPRLDIETVEPSETSRRSSRVGLSKVFSRERVLSESAPEVTFCEPRSPWDEIGLGSIWVAWQDVLPERLCALGEGRDVDWDRVQLESSLYPLATSHLSSLTGTLLYESAQACSRVGLDELFVNLVVRDVAEGSARGQPRPAKVSISQGLHPSQDLAYFEVLQGQWSNRVERLLLELLSPDFPGSSRASKLSRVSELSLLTTLNPRPLLRRVVDRFEERVLGPALDRWSQETTQRPEASGPRSRSLARSLSSKRAGEPKDFVATQREVEELDLSTAIPFSVDLCEEDVERPRMSRRRSRVAFAEEGTLELLIDLVEQTRSEMVRRTEVSIAIRENADREEESFEMVRIKKDRLLYEYFDSFVARLCERFVGVKAKNSGEVKGSDLGMSGNVLMDTADALGIKAIVGAAAALPFCVYKLRKIRGANDFVRIASSETEVSQLAKLTGIKLLSDPRKINHMQRVMAKEEKKMKTLRTIRRHLQDIRRSQYNSVMRQLAREEADILIQMVMSEEIEPEMVDHCRQQADDTSALAELFSRALVVKTALVEEESRRMDFETLGKIWTTVSKARPGMVRGISARAISQLF